MAEGILSIIQRKNPDKDFDILKQIGPGNYGEAYKRVETKATRNCELYKVSIIGYHFGDRSLSFMARCLIHSFACRGSIIRGSTICHSVGQEKLQ